MNTGTRVELAPGIYGTPFMQTARVNGTWYPCYAVETAAGNACGVIFEGPGQRWLHDPRPHGFIDPHSYATPREAAIAAVRNAL